MISSTEFVDYKVILQDEPNEFTPIFYYLAQIAAEVARANAKHPQKIKKEDFLLKFKFEKKQQDYIEQDDELDEETGLPKKVKKQMIASKGAWILAGMKRLPPREI